MVSSFFFFITLTESFKVCALGLHPSQFCRTEVLLLISYQEDTPGVCVWVNSNDVWVARSFPFMAADWEAARLSGPWELWVSINMGVITVFLRRQLESITYSCQKRRINQGNANKNFLTPLPRSKMRNNSMLTWKVHSDSGYSNMFRLKSGLWLVISSSRFVAKLKKHLSIWQEYRERSTINIRSRVAVGRRFSWLQKLRT